MSVKIPEHRLRQLVREEINKLCEDVDHEAIKHVVATAQKLLAAVEAFKNEASESMASAVELDELQKTLENMVSAPGSYIVSPERKQKVVHLRPAGDAGTPKGDEVL